MPAKATNGNNRRRLNGRLNGGRMNGGGTLGRIRRRTLSIIRWVAVAGQLAALAVVEWWLGVSLPLWPLLGLIFLSVLVNVVSAVVQRGSIWLDERQASSFLSYDLLQLGGLLALTGGLANPFAVLILAPVTVSASVLSARSTASLAAFAILLETLLALWSLPLPWFNGSLVLEPYLLGGLWAALVLATVFIAVYVASLADEHRGLTEALGASQMALAREQRLAALGGLAAAVAHELGSPLNTITLVARELAREVPTDSPIRADIELLVEETDRCRELLAELAARPEADGGEPYNRLPASVLLEAAAQPFCRDGVRLEIRRRGRGLEPVLPRDPALLHGLGTLIQNAVQFAAERVEVEIDWQGSLLEVLIQDDGPGFQPQVLHRLGEPYVSGNGEERAGDQGEEAHMGLGVFIAQTLLAHSGARMVFRNRPEGGAEVAISWSLAHLEEQEKETTP